MKKLVLGSLLTLLPLAAVSAETERSSNWVGGLNYFDYSKNSARHATNLTGLVGSIAYKIQLGNNFYLIPEFRAGSETSKGGVVYNDFERHEELKGFMAVSVRGQLELDNGLYFFAAPTSAKSEFTVTTSSYTLTSSGGGAFSSSSVTDKSWEFGIGAGTGYNFNKTFSAEFMYEKFDDSDVASVGLKIHF